MGRFANALAETRGQLQNPDRWFINMVSGHETMSGVDVDEDVALSSTAIFAGTRFLGETVGSLPLNIYRRRDNGRGKDLARDHSAFELLHDEPNPELTSMEFREMLQVHTILGGTSFALKVRDRGGTVREMWPVAPWRVEAKRDGNRDLYFSVRLPGDSRSTRVDASEMFWLRGFSRYGIMGESAIRLARESIGLGVAAEKFGAAFFGSGTTLSGLLTHPNQVSDKARKNMYGSFERKYSGLSNSHKVLLLEEGVEYQQIGVEPDKAQFVDTRVFQIQEASRILNIPPPFLHDLSRATFSNIDALALWLEKFTVRPWLVRWEQALNKRVIAREDRPDVFAEHIIEGLLRGDIQTRYEAFQTAIQNGWMSRNEAREKENMNPVPGGDTYLVNGNMAVVDDSGVPQFSSQPTEPRSDDSESLVEYRAERSLAARFDLRDNQIEIFETNAGRIINSEVRRIRRQADKLLRAGDVAAFLLWMEDFYDEHRGEVERVFGPVLRAYAAQIGSEIVREVDGEGLPEYESFVRDYTAAFADRHVAKSSGALRAVIRKSDSNDGGADAVLETLDSWQSDRTGRIAASETVRANGAFSRAAYAAAGVGALIWRARGDNCPLCSRLNGRIISIRSNFIDNGETLDVPGRSPFRFDRSIGHPPAHNGCDCGVGGASALLL